MEIILIHRCCQQGWDAYISYVKAMRKLYPEEVITTKTYNFFQAKEAHLFEKYKLDELSILQHAYLVHDEKIISL